MTPITVPAHIIVYGTALASVRTGARKRITLRMVIMNGVRHMILSTIEVVPIRPPVIMIPTPTLMMVVVAPTRCTAVAAAVPQAAPAPRAAARVEVAV